VSISKFDIVKVCYLRGYYSKEQNLSTLAILYINLSSFWQVYKFDNVQFQE